MGDIVATSTDNTIFSVSIEAGTVVRDIFADVVFQVLFISADRHYKFASGSLDLIAVIATKTSPSVIEGLAQVRSFVALIIDLVLSRSTSDLRNNTFAIDNLGTVLLASLALSCESIKSVTRFIDVKAFSKLEIFAFRARSIHNAASVDKIIASDAGSTFFRSSIKADTGESRLDSFIFGRR